MANNVHAALPINNKPEGTVANRIQKRLNNAISVQAIIQGAPTVAKVRISGTLDNVNFAELVTHTFSDEELVAGHALFHMVNKPVGTLQFEVLTLTGGTSPTMTIYVMEEVV